MNRFGALRRPRFRLFFAAQGLSMAGTWVHTVAQAVLVLELGASGLQLGVVTACQFAPIIAFGLLGGSLADRFDKRRLLAMTYTAMMAQAFLLAWLVAIDRVTILTVALLSIMMGIGTAIDNPSRRVAAGELVAPTDIGNAMALMSGLQYLMRVVGPLLAALLISTVDIAWCFALNAVSFGGGMVSLVLLEPGKRAAGKERLLSNMADGIRYVRSEPKVWDLLRLLGAVAFAGYNWQVLLPLLAERELNNAEHFTVLAAVMSIGAVAGSVWVAARTDDETRFLTRSAIALGLSGVLVGAAPSAPTLAAAVLVMGVAASCFLSGTMASLQVRSTPHMRGRVIAFTNVVVLGVAPLAGPAAGFTADVLGPRVAFVVGGLLAAVVGAAGDRAVAVEGRMATAP